MRSNELPLHPFFALTMEKGKVQFITNELIERTLQRAKQSPRLRMNYNFHADEADPVNRLLNAMHRGTFVPVHRHLNPSLNECGVVLRGSIGVVIYDDEGCVLEQRIVGRDADTCGFDIEAGLWHGLVVLEDNTVIYEVKQGPYTPISADNIAPWSPDVADLEAQRAFVKALEQSFE